MLLHDAPREIVRQIATLEARSPLPADARSIVAVISRVFIAANNGLVGTRWRPRTTLLLALSAVQRRTDTRLAEALRVADDAAMDPSMDHRARRIAGALLDLDVLIVRMRTLPKVWQR